MLQQCKTSFKKYFTISKNWRTSVLFVGATDTPVFRLLVTSALGFKAFLCASVPACNGIPRFTSGATPADLLEARADHSLSLHGFRPIKVLIVKNICCLIA